MKRTLALLLCMLLAEPLAFSADKLIENLRPTGDLIPLVQALESVPLYPVFVLPMGAGYFDFELKWSDHNFNPASANGGLDYFFASAFDAQPTNAAWDANVLVYVTSPAMPDPRVQYQVNTGQPILGQLGLNTASTVNSLIVIPSVPTPRNAFGRVFVYQRITAWGPEMDGNNRPVWNVIYPVAYLSQRPAPTQ